MSVPAAQVPCSNCSNSSGVPICPPLSDSYMSSRCGASLCRRHRGEAVRSTVVLRENMP